MDENESTGNEATGNEATAGAVDWRAGFSEELRAAPAIQDIASPEALAQSYIEQAAYLGNAIRPPGPDASSEDKAKFYAQVHEHAGSALIPRPDPEDAESREAFAKAMGRPDKYESYIPPELDGFNPERYDAAKETFHKLGLTQDQAAGLAAYEHGRNLDQYNAGVAERNSQHAQLEQEWGMTYRPRIDAITAWLVRDKAPEGMIEEVKDMPISTIKWMHDIYTRMGAGSEANNNRREEESGGLPPAEAVERANEIMTRLHSMHPGDTGYQALVDKRLEYMKMAHPDASQTTDDLRASPQMLEVTGRG